MAIVTKFASAMTEHEREARRFYYNRFSSEPTVEILELLVDFGNELYRQGAADMATGHKRRS